MGRCRRGGTSRAVQKERYSKGGSKSICLNPDDVTARKDSVGEAAYTFLPFNQSNPSQSSSYELHAEIKINEEKYMRSVTLST